MVFCKADIRFLVEQEQLFKDKTSNYEFKICVPNLKKVVNFWFLLFPFELQFQL